MRNFNRHLDHRIVFLLMIRIDLARLIIKTIEEDTESVLPFYSTQLRNDMLDTAHLRLREAMSVAKQLEVELDLLAPINHTLQAAIAQAPSPMRRITDVRTSYANHRVDVLCRFSTLLDVTDVVRFMHAVGFFKPSWREVMSLEIQHRIACNSPGVN